MKKHPPRNKDGKFKPYKVYQPKPVSETITSLPLPPVSHLKKETDDKPIVDYSLTYHKLFDKFAEGTEDATAALLALRPSTLSLREKDAAFKIWLLKVSKAYGIKPPALYWSSDADQAGGGFYVKEKHCVVMSPNRASLITLIHEYRHALQASKVSGRISKDNEIDARAWSLSLYYKVKPNLLKKLVLDGKVFHINPDAF